MACKYLTGFRIPGCLASERPMHPSVYEIKVFCHGKQEECVVYQNREENTAGSAVELSHVKATGRVRKDERNDAVSF